MYKYLIKESESHSSFHIEHLFNVAAEILHPSKSDALDEFLFDNSPSKICELFGFKDTEEVHEVVKNAIDDGELALLLYDQKKEGFLAEINIEVPMNIKFNDEGKPRSWSSGVVYEPCWVYGDSFHEMMQNAFKAADRSFEENAKEEYEKQINKKADSEA